MGYLLMFKINNLANQTSHIVTEQKGIFSIVEHNVDFSVAPCNAMEEYYMSQMNVNGNRPLPISTEKLGLFSKRAQCSTLLATCKQPPD